MDCARLFLTMFPSFFITSSISALDRGAGLPLLSMPNTINPPPGWFAKAAICCASRLLLSERPLFQSSSFSSTGTWLRLLVRSSIAISCQIFITGKFQLHKETTIFQQVVYVFKLLGIFQLHK